jgi:hypothetical protein
MAEVKAEPAASSPLEAINKLLQVEPCRWTTACSQSLKLLRDTYRTHSHARIQFKGWFEKLASATSVDEKKEWDVAIIGAGPAGLATWLRLRSIGIVATIFEWRRTLYIRDHIIYVQSMSDNHVERAMALLMKNLGADLLALKYFKGLKNRDWAKVPLKVSRSNTHPRFASLCSSAHSHSFVYCSF